MDTDRAEAPTDPSDDEYRPRWFHPPSAVQAVAMALALLLLGGILGWLATSRSDDPTATDVGFLQDMVTHHEQAVTMSEYALAGVTDVTTRRFAEEVLFFQAREIGIMQFLLEDWGYDLSERPDLAMDWMGMPVPVEDMTGLASEEDMDALLAATGDDVDRRFLDLMIEHHEGGAHMADWAADHASDEDVRELAEVMARNQRQEIEEYRLLQQRLGFPVTE